MVLEGYQPALSRAPPAFLPGTISQRRFDPFEASSPRAWIITASMNRPMLSRRSTGPCGARATHRQGVVLLQGISDPRAHGDAQGEVRRLPAGHPQPDR